eukprot:TRINITY_DN7252_c0_g1_i1.p2 TRINITY_DN7252_c0_g1~~TRINITY_DN7252_c0_g1_i1.p2  ORF type:complete len:103 (-),score=12.70 TRINITY_DN7252_c0_g1_i1:40-348(-)
MPKHKPNANMQMTTQINQPVWQVASPLQQHSAHVITWRPTRVRFALAFILRPAFLIALSLFPNPGIDDFVDFDGFVSGGFKSGAPAMAEPASASRKSSSAAS